MQELMGRRRPWSRPALAMEPVVYDFAINERGSWAHFR